MQRRTFTMLEIVIVVAIISLLAAIVIPQFMKYVGDSRRNACIANLKQIDRLSMPIAG
jgi:prepilin-type N-terminal cleavage/methylation domain-containing protein